MSVVACGCFLDVSNTVYCMPVVACGCFTIVLYARVACGCLLLSQWLATDGGVNCDTLDGCQRLATDGYCVTLYDCRNVGNSFSLKEGRV